MEQMLRWPVGLHNKTVNFIRIFDHFLPLASEYRSSSFISPAPSSSSFLFLLIRLSISSLFLYFYSLLLILPSIPLDSFCILSISLFLLFHRSCKLFFLPIFFLSFLVRLSLFLPCPLYFISPANSSPIFFLPS